MSDQKPNEKKEEPEVLKTFDMYTLFSRKDVIALLIMIFLLLIYVLYQAFFSVEAV